MVMTKLIVFWPTNGRRICANSALHKKPWILMPPHAAPLDMRYYNGKMFPELKGSLLISWHGYRTTGHRLVSYKVDAKGLPKRSKNAYYVIDADSEGGNSRRSYFSGVSNAAQADEIIGGMNKITGLRPKGRPVGITVAEDGAIWLLDDVQQSIATGC